jgi:hypothetical protein
LLPQAFYVISATGEGNNSICTPARINQAQGWVNINRGQHKQLAQTSTRSKGQFRPMVSSAKNSTIFDDAIFVVCFSAVVIATGYLTDILVRFCLQKLLASPKECFHGARLIAHNLPICVVIGDD